MFCYNKLRYRLYEPMKVFQVEDYGGLFCVLFRIHIISPLTCTVLYVS